jgi:hypothetical protein
VCANHNAHVCQKVTWAHTFGDFKLLNKLWLLDITPYKWDANASQSASLLLSVLRGAWFHIHNRG